MSNINISQLCISNPKESNAYSRIYVANPEKKFLEKFGKLAIIISIHFKDVLKNDTLSHTKDWIQNFIDFTSNNFYKTLRTGTEIEKEFEDLLQSLNKWLAKEKIQASELFEKHLAGIDISVIAVKNQDVYFASIGDIKTHLISAQSDKLQELLSGKDKSTKFSNLMNGSLEQDSVLFFASSNVFDYFSAKKIIQLLKDHPVKSATEEIKQLLSDEFTKTNLLFLVISRCDESLLAQIQKSESLEKASKDKEKITVDISKEEAQPTISVKTTKDKKESAHLRQKLLPLLLKILHGIRKSRAKKRLPMKLKLPKQVKTQGIVWQKVLFIILLIFGFLFIVSLIILGGQEYKSQKNRKYAQIIENLKEKESGLSVALIYDDETKVQTLMSEMQQLLNQLPQKTKEQKQTYDLFYAKYTTTLNKFYRLTTLEDPELLIDLVQHYKKIIPTGLTNLFNDFYIFDASKNYIYRFNIETKETDIVNSTSTNVGRLQKLTPLDNDILIGYDQNQGIVTFNTIDKKLEPVKLTQKHDILEITDLNLYNGRLYILKSAQNQIYKYSKTIDGFGKEEAWIQDNTNISDALSFTIDGSVYMLKRSSDIYKFFKGNRIEFELSDIKPLLSVIDPAITDTKGNIKLFTAADMRYLYLLDGPTNRFIILSKTGKLIKQFTSSKFDNLIDFIISRNENTVWLLNGTKIFEIEL